VVVTVNDPAFTGILSSTMASDILHSQHLDRTPYNAYYLVKADTTGTQLVSDHFNVFYESERTAEDSPRVTING